jgi:PAS domain S-box-containing protein
MVALRPDARGQQAALACDFPLVVWWVETGAVCLANEEYAALTGQPVDRLVGRRAPEVLERSEAVSLTYAALVAGALKCFGSERKMMHADGTSVPVSIWTRTTELDGSRAAISLVARAADIPRLGRDPDGPFRYLAPIALGTVGADWRVISLSSEIEDILGGTSSEWIGSSLVDLVRPDDRGWFVGAGRGHAGSASPSGEVRLRHRDGRWVEASVLVAPACSGDPGWSFALVGPPEALVTTADRIAEVELHLRRIAAEVRAAGVLDAVERLPTAAEFPQLAELSTRQWEVLERLLRGERVPTIARELFVSESTVRNHLAAIFRVFGVHSQDALIRLLRAGSSQTG